MNESAKRKLFFLILLDKPVIMIEICLILVIIPDNVG